MRPTVRAGPPTASEAATSVCWCSFNGRHGWGKKTPTLLKNEPLVYSWALKALYSMHRAQYWHICYEAASKHTLLSKNNQKTTDPLKETTVGKHLVLPAALQLSTRSIKGTQGKVKAAWLQRVWSLKTSPPSVWKEIQLCFISVACVFRFDRIQGIDPLLVFWADESGELRRCQGNREEKAHFEGWCIHR